MAYTSGLLKHRVTILNRTEAQQGRFGLDSAGIEWENMGCIHANVDWQKGKSGMTAGALDAYGVKIIRMRWNSIVTERSRINATTGQMVRSAFVFPFFMLLQIPISVQALFAKVGWKPIAHTVNINLEQLAAAKK